MRKNRVSRKLPALDLELLLSDISTNLFIVLLSVLAITSFASFSRSEKGFEIIANAEYTENSSLGLARGWSPIQQVHHRLVVRNNNLILLDLTPIAIALGNQVLFSSTNTPPNFDNTFILKNDMSPSGFALILDLSKTELPEELYIWKHKLNIQIEDLLLPKEVNDFFVENDGFDILIYPGSEITAWTIVKHLSEINKKTNLLFQKGEILGFQRNSQHYTFEATYK